MNTKRSEIWEKVRPLIAEAYGWSLEDCDQFCSVHIDESEDRKLIDLLESVFGLNNITMKEWGYVRTTGDITDLVMVKLRSKEVLGII